MYFNFYKLIVDEMLCNGLFAMRLQLFRDRVNAQPQAVGDRRHGMNLIGFDEDTNRPLKHRGFPFHIHHHFPTGQIAQMVIVVAVLSDLLPSLPLPFFGIHPARNIVIRLFKVHLWSPVVFTSIE